MDTCPHSDLPTFATVEHARINITRRVHAFEHMTFHDFLVHDCDCGRFHVTSIICPTPTKKPWLSRVAAANHGAKSDPGFARHQYRCTCGFWHLTTSAVPKEKSFQR